MWLAIAVVLGLLSAVLFLLPLQYGSLHLPLLALVAAAQAWFDLAQRLDNANLKPLQYGIAGLLKSLLVLLGGALAIHLGFSAEALLLITALALFSAGALQTQLRTALLQLRWKRDVIAKMLRYGAPLTLTFLMVFFIDLSGRFILDFYHGPAPVGLFSASYEFAQYIIGTLLMVVHLAGYPLIVRQLANGGLEAAQKQLQQSFQLVLLVAAPVCLGLALTAPELAGLFLGEEFRQGAEGLMPWVALILLLSVVKSYYFDYAFQLATNTTLQLWCVAAAAVVVIIVNLATVPGLAAMGAIYAGIAGFSTALVMSIVLGKRSFAMPAINLWAVATIAFACAVMALVVTSIVIDVLWLSLLAKVVAGLVSFSLVVLLTNYLNCQQLVKEFVCKRM